jgi:hypothetical protein
VKGRELTADPAGLQADVLDHAQEFVEIVAGSAPAEYYKLLELAAARRALVEGNNFNHGKLFAYAEFRVFRREFSSRFPQASPAACINAFCRVFLKNDISITNLVNFMEGNDERAQLQLNRPDAG